MHEDRVLNVHTTPQARIATPALAMLFAALFILNACQSPLTGQSSVQSSGPPVVQALNDPQVDPRVLVRKSPNDSRQYRYLTLPNKMRVLLVSDPETDKAAASMAVYRGSFHEPENRPGLAHFLEHMLFIQTQAYPEPGAFQKYVAANGGSTNAYTALDHTNYFFNVKPEAFAEALDRWAHFFIRPIISAEYSEREKNAVHSEYQMQIKDDGWRGYMVGKQALNPDHPATRFTIGSLDTLAGDIQADLIAFFDTQYSADQMGLVLISDKDLEQLESIVRPLFNQVVNKDIGPAYVDSPMYTSQQLPQIVSNQTFKTGATLTFAFPVPSTLPHYKKKPEQYFANLIGHEGKGSLYQYLSAKGWIESLGAGVSAFDRGSSVLNVNIQLTPLGESKRDEIGQALFGYIGLVRATPPQQWLYEEQAKVAELDFKFQEKTNPTGLVYQLAPRLDHYPAADLLVAPFLMEAFDPDLIRSYLSHLTPNNVVVEYTSPDVVGNLIEPWFQVPYRVDTFNFTPNEADLPLHLPAPNPFLPTDLALVTDDAEPIARHDDGSITVWLDTDVRFGSPRAALSLELAVDSGFVTPADRAQAQLYRLLVQDALSELAYPAYLAGLSYRLGVPDAGFDLHISGYNEKQGELLAAVLHALLNSEFSDSRFQALKATLIKDWANGTRERPFRQTYAALSDTLRSGRWPRQILIEALTNIELTDLNAWRENKLQAFSITGLLHGNVTGENLQQLTSTLKSALPISAVHISPVRPQIRDVTQSLLLEIPIEHNDSSLILHVQDDDASFSSRARSMLAAQMIQPEYFRQLRTEQQLGYVVSANGRAIAKRGGITFIVQSPTASAAAVEEATLKFVQTFNQTPIDAENFAQQKSGLIAQLLEKPKNLGEQSQRYWSDLTEDVDTFDSRQQIASLVEALTVDDIQTFLAKLESRMSSQRLLIFSRGKFDQVPTEGTKLADPTSAF